MAIKPGIKPELQLVHEGSEKQQGPRYLLKPSAVLSGGCQGMKHSKELFCALLEKLDMSTSRNEGSCRKTPTQDISWLLAYLARPAAVILHISTLA